MPPQNNSSLETSSRAPQQQPSDWCRDIFEESAVESVPAEQRPASQDWSIVRTETGPVHNPQHILSVRHQCGRPSRVLITTSDVERIAQVEGAARRALESLSSAAFAELMKFSIPS